MDLHFLYTLYDLQVPFGIDQQTTFANDFKIFTLQQIISKWSVNLWVVGK